MSVRKDGRARDGETARSATRATDSIDGEFLAEHKIQVGRGCRIAIID